MTKILAAWWQQETNSFNANRTTMQSFREAALLLDEEIVARFTGTDTDWGELIRFAGARDWELVTPLHAHAVPRGELEAGTFEQLTTIVLDAIRNERQIDGIFLMLHGSMVSEHYEDCEGELLRRVRALVGSSVPIAVTLDPHANVTGQMANLSNTIVSYQTTPHVDQVATTRLALDLFERMVDGGETMRVHLFKPPLAYGLDSGRTTTPDGPMPRALRRAEELQTQNKLIHHISIQAGFSYSDIAEIGPSIAITTSSTTDRVSRIGSELSRMIWDSRAERTINFLSVGEVIERIRSWKHRGKPLLVVDYADNPGGGAPGDDITLLRAFIDNAISSAVFFSLWAPEAVRMCRDADVGAEVSLSLRPPNSTQDLRLTGTVMALSDGRYTRSGPYFRGTNASLGDSALFRFDGIDIVLCSSANQTEERAQFRLFGVEFEAQTLIVCKGMNHFRADLEHLVDDLLFVDTGGVCTTDVTKIPYHNIRRPIWPLDQL